MRSIVVAKIIVMGGVELGGCSNLVRWLFIFFNIPILVRYLHQCVLRYLMSSVAGGARVTRSRYLAGDSGERP